MTIEFRCTTCGKLLRTQAGTEGKQAKCPECGTVLSIPSSGPGAESPFAPPPREPDFGAPPPHEPGADEAVNPYQSPGAYARAESVVRGFNPTRIDFAETFSKTWELLKDNLGACILGTVIYIGCIIFASILLNAMLRVSMAAAIPNEGAVVALVGVQQIINQVVNTYLQIGIMLYMLRIARGEGTDLAALFGGFPYLLYGLVIQIIVGLATFVGFLLLIVPGIIFALMLSQALFMLIDQRAGVIDSLKLSAEAMKGNKLTVFAIWIVAVPLGTVAGVMTCLVGFLFIAPFWALLMSVIYLSVTGQRTVLDVPAPPLPEPGLGATGAQPAG